jgi:Tfp pilus assembly protein PilF
VKGLIEGLSTFHKNYNYLVFPCIFFIYFLICNFFYDHNDSSVLAFSSTVATDITSLIDKGNSFYNSSMYDTAKTYYDEALYLDPNNIAALDNKGNDLERLGNYNEAITYLDKALAIDPNNIAALDNKGAALVDLGNYNEAITYLDKALAIDPNNIIALEDKGAALVDLGNYNEAIIYLDRTLAIDPNDKFAQDQKAITLEKLNNVNNSTNVQIPNPSNSSSTSNNASTSIWNVQIPNPSNSTSNNASTSIWNVQIPNPSNSTSNNASTSIRDVQIPNPSNSSSTSSSANTLLLPSIPTGYLTYTNPTYNISINYPSDWTKEEGAGTTAASTGSFTDIVTFVPNKYVYDTNDPVFLSVVIDTQPKSNLDSILKDQISSYKKTFKKIHIISSDTQSTLAGKPAYSLTMSANDNGLPVKNLETGVLIGDSVYYIQYEADQDKYDIYLPAVQNMVKSIQVSNPAP